MACAICKVKAPRDHKYFLYKEEDQDLTWRSPNSESRNEVDYMLVKKNIAQNVDVTRRVKVGSDHRLVRGKMKIPKN